MKTTGLFVSVPMTIGVNELFGIKIKVLGSVHEIPCVGAHNTKKPGLLSPFNLNSIRKIQYRDNVLPEWTGSGLPLKIFCAAADDLQEAVFVHNGENEAIFQPSREPKVIICETTAGNLAPGDFCYIRVRTKTGDMAWSSPVWIDRNEQNGRLNHHRLSLENYFSIFSSSFKTILK